MTDTKTGPSTLRAIARWATAFAEWEEGISHSPSAHDLVLYWEETVGMLPDDIREAACDEVYQLQINGSPFEALAEFLANCEHVQPHRLRTA